MPVGIKGTVGRAVSTTVTARSPIRTRVRLVRAPDPPAGTGSTALTVVAAVLATSGRLGKAIQEDAVEAAAAVAIGRRVRAVVVSGPGRPRTVTARRPCVTALGGPVGTRPVVDLRTVEAASVA